MSPVMSAAANPADSLHGVPVSILGDRSTTRITVPPDTGPPQAALQGQHQQAGQTWEARVGEIAARAAMAGVGELMKGAGPGEAKGRPFTAALALTLAIMANLGLVAAVAAHQIGNTAYEAEQNENNRLLREELAAQRRAIYGLIDVLAESDPRVRVVERDLQR